MDNVSLIFLATSLFCGILLPGDSATMISTALLAGSIVAFCLWLVARMRIKAVFSPWAMGGLFSLIAILIDGLAEPNVFTYRVDALLWMVIGIGYALYNAHDKPLAAQSMQEE